MTIQELRKYVDRVLGNSIRCLLPSFWWKKLFYLTLDEVDKKQDNLISGKNIKTVNGQSIIGSGDLQTGVKSVGSVDELNKMESKAGDIATVGIEGEYIPVDLSSCYTPAIDSIVEEWDNLTRIAKVEELHPTDSYDAIAVVLSTKAELGQDMLYVSWENSVYNYMRYVDGHVSTISKSAFDNLLANTDYRYIGSFSGIDNIEQIFKTYSKTPSFGEAYIKGDTWEKLLKDGESVSPAISSDAITFKITVDGNYELIQNEADNNHNKESVKKYMSAAGAGVYSQVQLECYISSGDDIVTPLSVSWELAGFDPYIGGGTMAIAFYNVIFNKLVFPFDVYFSEGFTLLQTHVNGLGSEFLYYRPQALSTMKPHNARVYEVMNKQFLNLFFVEQRQNGNEIFNAALSCAYIKQDDYFLISIPDIHSTRNFKLTSDGTLTFVDTLKYVDSEISAISTLPVQNKVVKAYVDSKINTPIKEDWSTTSAVISPNVYTVFKNTIQTLSITLGTPVDSSVVNDYVFEFTTSDGPIVINFPSSIKWANRIPPLFEANTTYQISIIRNLAVVTSYA